jgi:hypothetical protein
VLGRRRCRVRLFFLPVGAATAVSAQNPVRCIATRLSDGVVVTNDPNIHCGQAPSTGTYGGLFFGWAKVPAGWSFEIQVPVQFNQVLHGIAGPPSEQLQVVTTSTTGPTSVGAFVTVPAGLTTSLPVARSFPLNQAVAFSGTSVTSHSEGPFVQVAGSPTSFSLATTLAACTASEEKGETPVAKFAASQRTTSELGVTIWEVHPDGAGVDRLVGRDASGDSVVEMTLHRDAPGVDVVDVETDAGTLRLTPDGVASASSAEARRLGLDVGADLGKDAIRLSSARRSRRTH